MPRPTIAIQSAEVRIIPVYCCHHCGDKRGGDRATVTLGPMRAEDFGAEIERATRSLSNSHMPVGWASFLTVGNQPVHLCAPCIVTTRGKVR